ncbi:MAG: NCS2 family permease [Bdellovibrionota bacterium]
MSFATQRELERVRPSSVAQHVLAGLLTAIASSYSLLAVPAMLHSLLGVPYAGALTGTVLLASSMTILMGAYAKLPFVIVPSLGTCAVIAAMVANQHIPWQSALAVSFWTGIGFIVISFTSVREAIAVAIPRTVREAAVVGTGLLLIKAALTMEGMIWTNGEASLEPDWPLCLVGVVAALVASRYVPSKSLVIGICASTLAALLFHRFRVPETVLSYPEFSTSAPNLRYLDALSLGMVPVMLSIFCTDLVDSVATFVSVSQSMGLVKDDRPQNLERGMLVDSLATFVAGIFGTTPGSTSLQSVVASESAEPSGATAVCAGLWFLPCLVLAPMAAAVPNAAIAATLIVVGLKLVKHINSFVADLRTFRLGTASTALGTIAVVCVRDSLLEGVLFGATLWIGGKALRGSWKDLSVCRCSLAGIAIAYLVHQLVTS